MNEIQLSRLLASICAAISIYVAYSVLSSIEAVYSTALSWWSGDRAGALIVAFLVGSSVLSGAAIAYAIYCRKRAWWLFVLGAHVFLVVAGYPSYVLLVVLFAWWFSRHVYTAT